MLEFTVFTCQAGAPIAIVADTHKRPAKDTMRSGWHHREHVSESSSVHRMHFEKKMEADFLAFCTNMAHASSVQAAYVKSCVKLRAHGAGKVRS